MKKVWICSLATCVALVMSAGVFAHDDFTFVVSGPGEFTGETGSEHAGDYVVNLNHDEGAAGPGAQGWSYGLQLDGGTVTSATTDGTAVDAVLNAGFNKTSVIDPANNDGKQGAVSAVVLCLTGCPAVLPNVADIMKVGASFTIGAEDSSASFNVVDGLIGMGQPVQIVVTEVGQSADFETVDLEVELEVEDPTDGAGGAALVNGVPFVRGDANESGQVRLSDSVFVLDYLFAGTHTPSCLSALDSNDDGAVDISDAMFTLGFQFLGGPPPRAPYSDCGTGISRLPRAGFPLRRSEAKVRS